MSAEINPIENIHSMIRIDMRAFAVLLRPSFFLSSFWFGSLCCVFSPREHSISSWWEKLTCIGCNGAKTCRGNGYSQREPKGSVWSCLCVHKECICNCEDLLWKVGCNCRAHLHLLSQNYFSFLYLFHFLIFQQHLCFQPLRYLLWRHPTSSWENFHVSFACVL